MNGCAIEARVSCARIRRLFRRQRDQVQEAASGKRPFVSRSVLRHFDEMRRQRRTRYLGRNRYAARAVVAAQARSKALASKRVVSASGATATPS